jgi:hypothetical protein
MGRPPNKAGCPHPPRGKVPYKPPPPTKAAEAVLGRPVRIGGRQACRCSRMGCPESSKTVKSRRCESESFRKVPSAGTPRIRASPKLSALTAPPKSVRPLPIRASRWPDACPPPTRRQPPSHPAFRSPNSAAPRPDQVPGHFAPLHYGQISCVAPKHPSHHSRHASDRRQPTTLPNSRKPSFLMQFCNPQPIISGPCIHGRMQGLCRCESWLHRPMSKPRTGAPSKTPG